VWNVTLDDSDFERIEAPKEDLWLTWQESVVQAMDALEERENLD